MGVFPVLAAVHGGHPGPRAPGADEAPVGGAGETAPGPGGYSRAATPVPTPPGGPPAPAGAGGGPPPAATSGAPWSRRRGGGGAGAPPVDLSRYAGQRPTASTLRAATNDIMADITGLLAKLRQETPPAVPYDPAARGSLPSGGGTNGGSTAPSGTSAPSDPSADGPP